MASREIMPCRLVILGLVMSAVDAVPQVTSQSGEEAQLKCSFRLSPPTTDKSQLTVHWTKDGKAPSNQNFHKDLQLVEARMKKWWLTTLTIPQVTPADAGLYHCIVAYLEIEQEMCQVMLNVKESNGSLSITTFEPFHFVNKNQKTERSSEGGASNAAASSGTEPSVLALEVKVPHGQWLTPPPTQKPEESHRYLKVGMVLGVLVSTCGVTLLLVVCYMG